MTKYIKIKLGNLVKLSCKFHLTLKIFKYHHYSIKLQIYLYTQICI